MSDLYKVLGVGKKASRKQIRDAYREKAKTAHPDTGGSADRFALVKRAHDVLTDDERRDKYDKTGDDSDPKRDDSLQTAINILSMVLDKVLSGVEQRGRDPVEFDIISDMKTMLGGDIHSLEDHVRAAKKTAAKAERMLGRFSTSKGENFLEAIMRQKVEAASKNAEKLQEQLDTGKKAMDLLREYKFKHDVPTPNGARPSSVNMQDLMLQAFRGY